MSCGCMAGTRSSRQDGEQSREPPAARTVLANLINDVMVAGSTPAYRSAMARVTPRKLWTAQAGDCIVTLAPVPDDFADYVSRTSGLDLGAIDVVAPPWTTDGHALDVVEAEGAWDLLRARPDIAPFVIDSRVRSVARRERLRVVPYQDLPSVETLESVARINTKDGFRSIARSLGLPVADGGVASSVPQLIGEIEQFLCEHDAAIIKPDRGSNGFGNTVLHRADRRIVTECLQRALSSAPSGSGWVFEEFLPLE